MSYITRTGNLTEAPTLRTGAAEPSFPHGATQTGTSDAGHRIGARWRPAVAAQPLG